MPGLAAFGFGAAGCLDLEVVQRGQADQQRDLLLYHG